MRSFNRRPRDDGGAGTSEWKPDREPWFLYRDEDEMERFEVEQPHSSRKPGCCSWRCTALVFIVLWLFTIVANLSHRSLHYDLLVENKKLKNDIAARNMLASDATPGWKFTEHLRPPSTDSLAFTVERPYAETVKCIPPFGTRYSQCVHQADDVDGKPSSQLNVVDRCFDSSRCLERDFKVYVYPDDHRHPDTPAPEAAPDFAKLLSLLRSREMQDLVTRNPDEACIFFPNVDISSPHSDDSDNRMRQLHRRLISLPHWSGGLNHVIWEEGPDLPGLHSPGQLTVRWKSSDISEDHPFRPGFDLSVPLWLWHRYDVSAENTGEVATPSWKVELEQEQNPFAQDSLRSWDQEHSKLVGVPASRRPVLASFKGKFFLEEFNETERETLTKLHDGRQWRILTACCHEKQPWCKAPGSCDEAKRLYTETDRMELMASSTFCILPQGAGLHSVLLLDAMSAGCIPVLVVKDQHFVPPLSGQLEWSTFSVSVPASDFKNIHSILRAFTTSQLDWMYRNLRYVATNYFASPQLTLRRALELVQKRVHCRLLTRMYSRA